MRNGRLINKYLKIERSVSPENMETIQETEFDIKEVLNNAEQGDFDALDTAFLIFYYGIGVTKSKNNALTWAYKMLKKYPDDGISKERIELLLKN